MNGAEFKQIEGQRLQQVLSAIGALPAALLVFGDSPATSAPGAPLFVLAIACGLGALMFMTYTDGIFYLDSSDFVLPKEAFAQWELLQAELEAVGLRFQISSVAYGCSSLILSLMGIAAVYSPLRTGVPATVGFVVAIAAAIIVCSHVSWGRWKTNILTDRCRSISVHDRPAAPIHYVCIVPPAPSD